MTPDLAPFVAWLAALIEPMIERALKRALAEQGPKQVESGDCRLLSRAALSSALGVSGATIGRWTREGLPQVQTGGAPRYRLAEVQAWLDSRKPEADSPKQPRPARDVVSLAGVRRCSRRPA